jgi:hypothetical protein
MRLTALCLLTIPMAGCIPFPIGGIDRGIPLEEVRVAAVEVTPTRLSATMSNGDRCRAERPETERGGWSGVTSDCPFALPFTVTFQQAGSGSRFIIEDPTGVPVGEDGGPGPRAEVFLTDVDGQRRLFIAPLGPNVRFETMPPAS